MEVATLVTQESGSKFSSSNLLPWWPPHPKSSTQTNSCWGGNHRCFGHQFRSCWWSHHPEMSQFPKPLVGLTSSSLAHEAWDDAVERASWRNKNRWWPLIHVDSEVLTPTTPPQWIILSANRVNRIRKSKDIPVILWLKKAYHFKNIQKYTTYHLHPSATFWIRSSG